MSDSVTNVQIEDVLSSIRKLVSEEVRSQTKDKSVSEPPLTRGGEALFGRGAEPAARKSDGPTNVPLAPEIKGPKTAGAAGPALGTGPGMAPGAGPGAAPTGDSNAAEQAPMFRATRGAQTPATPPDIATPKASPSALNTAQASAAPMATPRVQLSPDPAKSAAKPAASGDDRLVLTPSQRIAPTVEPEIPEAPHIHIDEPRQIETEADILNLMRRVNAPDDTGTADPGAEVKDADRNDVADLTGVDDGEIPAFLRRTGVTSLEQRIAELEETVSKTDGDYEPEVGAEADFGAEVIDAAIEDAPSWASDTVPEPGDATTTVDPLMAEPLDIDPDTDFDTIRAEMEHSGPSGRRAAFDLQDGENDQDAVTIDDALSQDTGSRHTATYEATSEVAEPEVTLSEAALSEQAFPDKAPAEQDHSTSVPADVELAESQDDIQEWEDADDTSHAQPAAPEMIDTGVEYAAALQSQGEDDPALDTETLASDDPAVIDEEMLRDLISEIVRQELQGALGERITRNVRRLVRREIQRALSAHDLT